jgi:hypothetical protein
MTRQIKTRDRCHFVLTLTQHEIKAIVGEMRIWIVCNEQELLRGGILPVINVLI